jgi:hypothetical protein
MKVVKESLYEKFEKESDPIHDLDIGPKIEITAKEMRPGDIVIPFIDEHTMKRTRKRIEIIDGPFECQGGFKDIYILFKTKGGIDDELIIMPDEPVLLVGRK